MTPAELEAYLHNNIPLTKACGIRVAEIMEDGIRLAAPLDVNINHLMTAFGGSIATVAITAGWAFIRMRLEPGTSQLVIHKCEMEFIRPITADFEAICHAPRDGTWHRFERRVAEKGKSRITLKVDVLCKGELACVMNANYAIVTARELEGDDEVDPT